LAAGCRSGPEVAVSPGPERPFQPSTAEVVADREIAEEVASRAAAAVSSLPAPRSDSTYGVAELVDMAQRRNPLTRQAWAAARRAGREAGVLESALLPVLTASVFAAAQRIDTGIDPLLLEPTTLQTDVRGVAGILAATWLLFDFGENGARRKAVAQLARVRGFGFNRVHQQLAFDVVTQAHLLDAARRTLGAARRASARSDVLVDAAEERHAAGVGTEVEVAQARQLQAQTRVIERRVEGELAVASVSLAASLNVPLDTRIQVRMEAEPSLGTRAELDAYLEAALSNRPEVLAALAGVQAARHELDAVGSSAWPKIYAGGHVLVGTPGLRLDGFEPLGIGNNAGTGIFLGLTVPLFDGNLRSRRLEVARDGVEAAMQGVGVARAAAAREVALAYEGLLTARAVRDASQALLAAARTTVEAAEAAYATGIGTVTDVSVAALGAFGAEQAVADARAALFQAAAALALSTGQVPWESAGV
jgi:outer membrane protein TolC